MRGYPLDGHVNRELEGKTIRRALKNGRTLELEMDNGERFQIAWATPNGIGVDGEPCLVKVDVRIVVPQVSVFGTAGSV
jgi:hypothetical protein